MEATIQKWGNSLGLRIPRAIALDAGLLQGTAVDIKLNRGRVVVSRTRRKKYSLEELCAGITRKNRHGEFEMGPPVGREVW